MQKTIKFLKTIADKNRLTILYLLKENTLCVCDIQKVIPLSQGALSIQLKNLSTEGLLISSKRGKWVFYKLSDEITPSHLLILSELFNTIQDSDEIKNITNNLDITEKCK